MISVYSTNMNENSRHDYLVAKVKARNILNSELKQRVPAMIEALKPFIGQKVQKVDGTLLQKVRDALPNIPNAVAFGGWYESRGYSIYARFETCVWEGLAHGCIYQEDSFCIGDVQDGILKAEQRVSELSFFRSDWTVEEVEKARENVRKAKEALSDAQRPLYHFGEYDN